MPLDEKPERLEKHKIQVLERVLDSLSQIRPASFYSKAKCNYSDTNQRISFKTSIRAIKDSLINPLITYAGIPIVNSLIRPDSLFISNRKDKCYIKTTVGYIKDAFGVDFEYKNIEELLLGLPVAFDTTERYFLINNPFKYIVSSHRKHILKKESKEFKIKEKNHLDRSPKKEDLDDQVLIQYYINSSLTSIDRIIVDSPSDTTRITVDYLSRDTISSFLMPKDLRVDIQTKRNHIVLEMAYDRSEINTPQEIRFIIPEEYEECTSKK